AGISKALPSYTVDEDHFVAAAPVPNRDVQGIGHGDLQLLTGPDLPLRGAELEAAVERRQDEDPGLTEIGFPLSAEAAPGDPVSPRKHLLPAVIGSGPPRELEGLARRQLLGTDALVRAVKA